jgi:hypothetical protein
MHTRRASTFWQYGGSRLKEISRMTRMLPIISALALCILATTSQADEPCKRQSKYTGTELKATTILCKSDQVAFVGFARSGSMMATEYGGIGKESTASTWRITIKGDMAEVIRFSGATQTLEEPEVFSVERTFGGGILLTFQSRGHRVSPQIITVDRANSSFIYSSQHVNPSYNRASLFYGSCQPYQ